MKYTALITVKRKLMYVKTGITQNGAKRFDKMKHPSNRSALTIEKCRQKSHRKTPKLVANGQHLYGLVMRK